MLRQQDVGVHVGVHVGVDVGVVRLLLDRQSSVPYQDAHSNSGAYIWMHA